MASTTDDAAIAALKINATPFVESIIFAPKSKTFQAPNFQQFNGKTNHEDHLNYYKQKLAFETDDDATLSKVFPTSLTGPALNWLCGLPPNSVKNFHDLCTQFIAQYFCNRKQPKTASHLFNLK